MDTFNEKDSKLRERPTEGYPEEVPLPDFFGERPGFDEHGDYGADHRDDRCGANAASLHAIYGVRQGQGADGEYALPSNGSGAICFLLGQYKSRYGSFPARVFQRDQCFFMRGDVRAVQLHLHFRERSLWQSDRRFWGKRRFAGVDDLRGAGAARWNCATLCICRSI